MAKGAQVQSLESSMVPWTFQYEASYFTGRVSSIPLVSSEATVFTLEGHFREDLLPQVSAGVFFPGAVDLFENETVTAYFLYDTSERNHREPRHFTMPSLPYLFADRSARISSFLLQRSTRSASASFPEPQQYAVAGSNGFATDVRIQKPDDRNEPCIVEVCWQKMNLENGF